MICGGGRRFLTRCSERKYPGRTNRLLLLLQYDATLPPQSARDSSLYVCRFLSQLSGTLEPSKSCNARMEMCRTSLHKNAYESNI